jgi:hypothetical protein
MPANIFCMRFLRFSFAGIVATGLAALSACGGGGDSGGNSPEVNSTPTTGSVAVLFTDAPTDQFCHVFATVQSIDLLGSNGPTNVYTGPETVDLLAMRNFTDYFSIDTSVPVGQYEKARMTLSDLALVECDAAGVPEPAGEWEHPHLPGNGKLDLNPRGTFEVIGGETMVIELDMDMEKSLHVHQAGNGKWQFRPVVFVTIEPDDSKLVRVFGQVRNFSNTTFELCPIEPVSSVDNDGPVPGSECIDVVMDGNTSVFGDEGNPGSVANDDLVTAIGFLGLHDDADGDSRMDDLKLDAVVIEVGPLGTFARIRGKVVTAPGNNDLFVFDPSPLDDATNAIDVTLQAGTRVFALGSNDELTWAAIQPGTPGEVNGVFTDPATKGEPLKSSLIVLDQDATPDSAVLDGEIKTIDPDNDAVPATRRIAVDTATVTGQCVMTDAGTRYLLITETSSASETAEIAFADLAVGDHVDVYGRPDLAQGDCVLADTIQKYPAAP